MISASYLVDWDQKEKFINPFSHFTSFLKTTELKKIKILFIICASSFFLGCDSDEDSIIDPYHQLLGYWKYEYELLDDGSKNYNNPYALLEFTYSDGFILEENKVGSSVWYDSINGEFNWEFKEGALILTVSYDDGAVKEFVHSLTEIRENTLIFNSLKGHTYFMRKVKLPID